MKRPLLAMLLLGALPAMAGDFSSIGALSQDQFRKVSEDLGAALSYKGVTPATPLGLVGFDIGVEVSATDIANSDIFRLAGNSAPDYIAVPKVHIYKGLPYGIDIGAFVGGAPEVSANLYGLDLRVAMIDDGVATPSSRIAQRASRPYSVALTSEAPPTKAPMSMP